MMEEGYFQLGLIRSKLQQITWSWFCKSFWLLELHLVTGLSNRSWQKGLYNGCLLNIAGARWFHISFIFIPFVWVNDRIWLSHTFQMGWFNHQLNIFRKKILRTWHFLKFFKKNLQHFPEKRRLTIRRRPQLQQGKTMVTVAPFWTQFWLSMSQLVTKKEGNSRGFYLLFVPQKSQKIDNRKQKTYHSPKCHWHPLANFWKHLPVADFELQWSAQFLVIIFEAF